jgi:hypothetical protein
MELTPLCGREIAAFLQAGRGSTAFPVYHGGAACAER